MVKISAIATASIGISLLLATTSLLLLPEAFALSIQGTNQPTPSVIGCPRGEIPFFVNAAFPGHFICIAIGDIFGSTF